MTMKSQLALAIGKSSAWFLKTFTQGGSALPGKLALSIDPDLLSTISQDYEVAVITGTNGKTLTTSLSVQAVKQVRDQVLTNATGANMQQGIVSTFITAPTLNQKGLAILEVDEGSLKHVVKHLQPSVMVFTNLFEDQVDRFNSVEAVYQLLLEAAEQAPQATIIANGDLPLFANMPVTNPKLYFGFTQGITQPSPNTKTKCPTCGHELIYHSTTYGSLGNYECPSCKLRRPELTFQLNKVIHQDLNGSSFEIDGQTFYLPIAGLYNIYNALAAYSLAHFLGVPSDAIQSGMEHAERVAGRQEEVNVDGKKVQLNLVKNPVGLNQVIDLLAFEEEESTVFVLLNNNYADGQDIDWIWQGNFQVLNDYPIRHFFSGGMCKEAMTQRLLQADIPENKLSELDSLDQVIPAIQEAPTERIHVLATFTALADLSKLLTDKGYL
ncbi:MurT ligase domain-containing protein [Hutsoniella sourekii]